MRERVIPIAYALGEGSVLGQHGRIAAQAGPGRLQPFGRIGVATLQVGGGGDHAGGAGDAEIGLVEDVGPAGHADGRQALLVGIDAPLADLIVVSHVMEPAVAGRSALHGHAMGNRLLLGGGEVGGEPFGNHGEADAGAGAAHDRDRLLLIVLQPVPVRVTHDAAHREAGERELFRVRVKQVQKRGAHHRHLGTRHVGDVILEIDLLVEKFFLRGEIRRDQIGPEFLELRALEIGADARQVGGVEEQSARRGGAGSESLGGAARAAQGEEGAEPERGAEELAAGERHGMSLVSLLDCHSERSEESSES